MPTYRYECTKCGRTFAFFQSITEAPKKRCPECAGRLQRLISGGAGVILKGSGFHRTDYRSKSWHKAAKSEKGESSKEGTGPKDGGSKDSGGGKDGGAPKEGGGAKDSGAKSDRKRERGSN